MSFPPHELVFDCSTTWDADLWGPVNTTDKYIVVAFDTASTCDFQAAINSSLGLPLYAPVVVASCIWAVFSNPNYAGG